MIATRFDRLLTLYCFSPLGRLAASDCAIPVLMYHSISEGWDDRAHPYFQIATTPRVFAEHMMFLRRMEYRVITLAEAVDLAHNAITATKKAIAITFDDGYQDFYTCAFPVLNEFGFTATVFLPTNYIGDMSRKFHGVECLDWSQVRELQRLGIHFGSHTVTHSHLRSLETDEVCAEVRMSKSVIEDKLGVEVLSFSYPFAFPETDRRFTNTLRRILAESGYQNGVSTIVGMVGRGTDRFFMKRLPVNSGDDLNLFRAKLEGAYNWVHALQYVHKLTWNDLKQTLIAPLHYKQQHAP